MKAEFNTISDIRLRNFTNTTLPSLSIQAANSLLIEKFQNIILPNQAQGFGLKDESALFFDLFERIKKEAAGNFTRFSDSIKTERSAGKVFFNLEIYFSLVLNYWLQYLYHGIFK